MVPIVFFSFYDRQCYFKLILLTFPFPQDHGPIPPRHGMRGLLGVQKGTGRRLRANLRRGTPRPLPHSEAGRAADREAVPVVPRRGRGPAELQRGGGGEARGGRAAPGVQQPRRAAAGAPLRGEGRKRE